MPFTNSSLIDVSRRLWDNGEGSVSTKLLGLRLSASSGGSCYTKPKNGVWGDIVRAVLRIQASVGPCCVRWKICFGWSSLRLCVLWLGNIRSGKSEEGKDRWESGTWKNKASENGTYLVRAKICCYLFWTCCSRTMLFTWATLFLSIVFPPIIISYDWDKSFHFREGVRRVSNLF